MGLLTLVPSKVGISPGCYRKGDNDDNNDGDDDNDDEDRLID